MNKNFLFIIAFITIAACVFFCCKKPWIARVEHQGLGTLIICNFPESDFERSERYVAQMTLFEQVMTIFHLKKVINASPCHYESFDEHDVRAKILFNNGDSLYFSNTRLYVGEQVYYLDEKTQDYLYKAIDGDDDFLYVITTTGELKPRTPIY